MLPRLIHCGAEHSNGKKLQTYGDPIVNLPDDVINNILARLPLKQSARTSILSRTWRYTWTRVPQLIFDDAFSKEITRSQQPNTAELMVLVCGIMWLHQAPIQEFNLSIPGLASCREIDKVIQFLSRNRIMSLTLHIKIGRHKLPSHFFLCQPLKYLNLMKCELRCPSVFQGFRQLIKLELNNVIFTGCTMESFISSCPVLVELVFHSRHDIELLELSSPSLRYLYISAHILSFSFKNVPQLLELEVLSKVLVDLDMVVNWNTSTAKEFLDCLARIRFLSIDYVFVKRWTAGNVLLRHPTTLRCLQNLCLIHICFHESYEISCALWLLSNSPNLNKLRIEMDSEVPDGNDELAFEFMKVQDYSNFRLHQLREVDMRSFSGLRTEVELIRILLEKSRGLRNFSVQSVDSLSLEKQVELCKKILDFPRASAMARIKYS